MGRIHSGESELHNCNPQPLIEATVRPFRPRNSDRLDHASNLRSGLSRSSIARHSRERHPIHQKRRGEGRTRNEKDSWHRGQTSNRNHLGQLPKSANYPRAYRSRLRQNKISSLSRRSCKVDVRVPIDPTEDETSQRTISPRDRSKRGGPTPNKTRR